MDYMDCIDYIECMDCILYRLYEMRDTAGLARILAVGGCDLVISSK
jgi:hypothetical protein